MRRIKLPTRRVLGFVLLSSLFLTQASVADFFVSTTGNDANPGTKAKPLASLAGARDLIRKSGLAGKEPVTVLFGAGTYYLPNTVVFTAEDSGTEKTPVLYKANEEGKAVLSGGEQLHLKWQLWKDGIYKAETPAGLVMDQLFVNGKRQNMARYPNYDASITVYNGFAADAFSKERAARWTNPVGGYIHAMHVHHWGGYHYRITGKNAQGEVTYEGGWQNNRQMGMHKSNRFVENIFEELDAPEEWYHDRATKTLYYYPPKDLDVNTATIEGVRLACLIEFKGSNQKPVKGIRLNGFTFQHSARTFMENKEPLLRSDWTIYRGGAVTFNGASDCEISDTTFDQPGANAVFVNNWNRRLTIRGCLFTEVGASGVAFVGDPASVRNPLLEYNKTLAFDAIDKTPGPLTDNYPSECLVDDCLMARTGRIEKQGAGVQLSMCSKITVRHCTIYDTSRSGININEGTFGGHIIEFCDIFDTVKETGDHGSFNSWGRDRFWHLQNAPEEQLPELAKLDMVAPNTIRNSRWRCDHGWDIDLDDGSSNYEIYNNLLLNGGLKMREGFNRKAYNNIIVNNSLHPHVWYKNSGDVFTNNIVMGSYKPAAINKNMKWGKAVDYNIFTSTEGDRTRFAEQGCDEHSIVADVKFVDASNGDFRVKDTCASVFAMGFKNFPMDQFGVQKKSLKALARTPVIPALKDSLPPATISARAVPLIKKEQIWQQAKIKSLEGEEYSSYGAGKDDGGVALIDVPAYSLAAAIGLKTGDLIQKIDGVQVKTAGDLLNRTQVTVGKPMVVGLIRNQQSQTVNAARHLVFETEGSNDDTFKDIALKGPKEIITFANVTTSIKTLNDPLSILSDGKLAKGYGPVFANAVMDGMYQIDLGRVYELRSVATWSYNQGENRAAQHFSLYGSRSETNPCWDLKKYEAISSVSVAPGKAAYVATRISESKKESLGKYRWLIWATSPVTEANENTAFQEFQVEALCK